MTDRRDPDRRNWSRFDWDSEDEDTRILDAHLKKLGYSRWDRLNLGARQWNRLRLEAMANRHLYRIPVTDPEHLYHGTSMARLAGIVQLGLEPQESTRWAKDGYAGHAVGRVFFSDTILKANFYAVQASKTRPIILRVQRCHLGDIEPDLRETEGNYFIERSVPPWQVSIWSGKGWALLAKPSPEHVSDSGPGLR